MGIHFKLVYTKKPSRMGIAVYTGLAERSRIFKKRSKMSFAETNLIWIDMEMSGLNPEQDRILEIATLVTDSQLNILAIGPVFAINQSETCLGGMDAWNQKHHGESGLIDKVRASQIREEEAMNQTLDFLVNYVPKGVSPLCGNSVWQDRRFLARYMPALEAYCHYRLIDVSTVKELMLRWRPDLSSGFKKISKHEALADIQESIAELIYYRQHFFNLSI